MKLRLTTILAMLCVCVFTTAQKAELKKQGHAVQMVADGKPMLILGGELSNSAATSIADIEEVMPRMKAIGLNTVLVPAYWDLIEPTEGDFNFELTDKVIDEARANDLKVIFLWFGAWKNSMSCYAPLWFKKDTKRFPRSETENGKPLEIASAFSEEVFQADSKAFSAWLRHTAEKDKATGTVIMIQIENEIGMLESARDHSRLADKEFEKWCRQNKVDASVSDPSVDERFMATYYARYVERMAKIARSIYDIPLYVNAAMNSRGRKPGEYPSAGPLAHLMDIWKKEAPSVDIMAPDIYDTGFASWASQYYVKDKNPLFIPESRCCINSGVRAFYVFGEYDALGFSPFAIDQTSKDNEEVINKSYALLKELSPLLLKYQGKGLSHGLLFDQENKERIIEEDDLTIIARHNFTLPWDPRATDGSVWPEGGGIILKLDKYEYVVAGNGIVVEFKSKTEMSQNEQKKKLGEDGFLETGDDRQTASASRFSGRRIGLGSVDEVGVSSDGTLRYVRRENGDQDHQGRHARISVGDYKILHIRLYQY